MPKVLQDILRRNVIRATGFIANLEPMPMTKRFKMSIEVLGNTILDRAIEIVAKSRGHIRVGNGIPGQDREISF